MVDGDATLHTRWSMLGGLTGTLSEESWRWFIDRYQDYIRIGIERVVRPQERAARAAEEFWSYVFSSAMLENAERSRRFRTYLAGTVRNYARDWLRRNVPADAPPPEDLAVVEDPAAAVEAEDLRLWKRQVVQLALEELRRSSAEQADALRWFYGLPEGVDAESAEPRSASWIAAQLGTTANAVHQLVFRGRKRLRACLEAELRETVGDVATLREEMGIVLSMLDDDHPGLSEG